MDEVWWFKNFFFFLVVDGGYCVVIVDSVDEMNVLVVNVFLKLFEELFVDIMFLLISY